MRIAIISDWFSESMGYSENCLPKALAELGHDVHLITSDAQPYFDAPGYAETYESFIGPGLVQTEVKAHDGYTLHRLPHGRIAGRFRIRGLRAALSALRPDVVQTFEVSTLSTLEAALLQPTVGYKLFLESHVHASVFQGRDGRKAFSRLKWKVYRRSWGALVSRRAVKCYPISPDAAKIAVDWMGIAADKIEICSLGVDTNLFQPRQSAAQEVMRSEIRAELGFVEADIVCIYTGRFSPTKGPHILAEAIGQLVEAGEPFRALFVGSGTGEEMAALSAHSGVRIHPFVPARQLPPLYWAADIGVWPRQESTSQLDAAACGLPIILSNLITVTERVDGNGLTYREGHPTSLADAIRQLSQAATREKMGAVGAERMRTRFSWRVIAEQRVRDYSAPPRS